MKIENLEKIYDSCLNEGKIKEKQPDLELIKSIKIVAEKGLKFIKEKSKDIPSESSD